MTPALRKRFAVLISGRGSNLAALIEAAASAAYPAYPVLVVSSHPEAAGLAYAAAADLPREVLVAADYAGDAYGEALDARLRKAAVDIVCLAGFMHILSPAIVRRWRGRMLNIHPSLLPAYPGLNPHAGVLADRQTQSGCTVHFVTEDLDAGPIILQTAVPVATGSTPESLAADVLTAEHRLYPKALAMVARGEAQMEAG